MNYWQDFLSGEVYHVYSRTIAKEACFSERHPEHAQQFLSYIKRNLAHYVDFYAYALIPNHFHFIIRVRPEENIPKAIIAKEQTKISERYLAGEISYSTFLIDQFKRSLQSFSMFYNRKTGRTGSLWQKRFKRIQLVHPARIVYGIAYVHHNEIHHLKKSGYGLWKWSSYKALLSNRPTLISRASCLDLFRHHDRQCPKEAFIEYHKNFKLDSESEDFEDFDD